MNDNGNGAASLTHVNHFEVRVPTPEDGDIVVDVRARRADVVHRLLDLGVHRCTLATLLPEWSELIELVASEHGEPS